MPKAHGMASYAMLSQDGDNRDREITRGLGRSLRFYDPVKERRCCKPWFKWTFITLVIILVVTVSVLVPLAFILSPDVFPLAAFVQHKNATSSETVENLGTTTEIPTTSLNDANQAATGGINITTANSGSTISPELIGSNETAEILFPINVTAAQPETLNVTSNPTVDPNNSTAQIILTTSPNPESANNTNTSSLYDSVVSIKNEVYDWAERTFSELPLLPTIITGSAIFLALTTILWLVMYRRIVRRQRRKAISKMITDLQAGDKSVLLSNSSDEE